MNAQQLQISTSNIRDLTLGTSRALSQAWKCEITLSSPPLREEIEQTAISDYVATIGGTIYAAKLNGAPQDQGFEAIVDHFEAGMVGEPEYPGIHISM